MFSMQFYFVTLCLKYGIMLVVMIKKITLLLSLFSTTLALAIPAAVEECFKNLSSKKTEIFTPRYATGFRYYKKEDFIILESQGKFFLLSSHHKPPPCLNIPNFNIPIKTLVTFSTTHLPFIQQLKKENLVLGFAGMEFVNNPIILEQFKKGKTKDVAYPPREEMLLSLKPDAIFTYAVQQKDESELEHQKKLGLPMVPMSEYKEDHPLARAEWLIFMGLFFDQENVAKEIFSNQVDEYERLRLQLKKISFRPRVIIGELQNGVWYAPRGGSDLARLIEDAGADYVWKDKMGKGFMTISFEEVLKLMSSHSGELFWLPQNSWTKGNEIIKADPRYKTLGLFKNVKIFNHNLIYNKKGYSDYWETGIANPHLLLKDLISIFHPKVLSTHQRKWYHELKL